jgi:hypothetical protein
LYLEQVGYHTTTFDNQIYVFQLSLNVVTNEIIKAAIYLR